MVWRGEKKDLIASWNGRRERRGEAEEMKHHQYRLDGGLSVQTDLFLTSLW